MAQEATQDGLSPPVHWIIGILLATLAIIGFCHLGADFPNNSRWIDDPAKFTDEGWYAAGALNHILTGHWLRPGDFNPIVTVPVWPVLLDGVFHFTGISLPLARATAFLFTLGSVLVAGALFARVGQSRATLLMLLVLANPTLYFFSRLAILEAALLFFLITSALLAASPANDDSPAPSAFRVVLCGVVFMLAILTKTSAAFAAPAILYLLWFPLRHRRAEAFRTLAIAIATVVVLYGAYWLVVIRTHPSDVGVLLGQNHLYLGIRSIQKAVRIVYRSATWIDFILYPVALLGVAASCGPLRSLWRNPIYGFAILFYIGYSGFLLLHFDAGPRYFAILVLPVAIIVVLFQQEVQLHWPKYGTALGAVILLGIAANLAYIGKLLVHPTYTLRDADLAFARIIDADPIATRMVIGHGGLESTFTTHIPALDDIGEQTVAEKIAAYHPGWVITYSDEKLGIVTQPDLTAKYDFIPRGRYDILDNIWRPSVLLFRIVPKHP